MYPFVTVNPGTNVIQRSSRESSVTISKERKFEQLLRGEGTTEHSSEYCSCGWPDHLLIPKGNDKGMEFHLFVQVTDHLKDLVSSTICYTYNVFITGTLRLDSMVIKEAV